MEDTKPAEPVRYSNYLELDKILAAQHPKSMSSTLPVHDEKLFIIVHQVFELWFLQIIHELDYVSKVLEKDEIDDNSEEMMRIVQRLNRVTRILRHANAQFEILESMEPLDFLEFRSLLGKASGFQSKQFRLIEIKLGLRRQGDNGHYKHTGTGGFTEEERDEIDQAEAAPSVLTGLKKWLSRSPFFKDYFWEEYELQYPDKEMGKSKFMADYFNIYKSLLKEAYDTSIAAAEKDEEKKKAEELYAEGLAAFRKIFVDGNSKNVFSPAEMTAALFIMLYRHIPVLRLPYGLINSLIEIDELMSAWRYNHYLLVKKMIGAKPGTGESAGAAYLFEALQKNNVFGELTFLATYFIERAKLPVLTDRLKTALNFNIK
jgi:tryptophan 2,3-dioxygenase